MLDRLEDILRNDKSRTYLFAASTSACKKKIEVLKQAADNLFYTEMAEIKNGLKLRVARVHGASFSERTIKVPFSP